jgi:ABC-type glycerol-3-phosphate transport system substrate-binding protein
MVKTLLVLASVLMLTGCRGTPATQAVRTPTAGPEGQYLIVRQGPGAAPTRMTQYKAVEVAEFENELPGAIKANVVQAVRRETVSLLLQSKNLNSVVAVKSFSRGGMPTPTLVITGRLVDIASDKVPGQKLLGTGNQLIARVKLCDKMTGEVLVEAKHLPAVAADALEHAVAVQQAMV